MCNGDDFRQDDFELSGRDWEVHSWTDKSIAFTADSFLQT